MGQINVLVGGRAYTLACRDGEEDRLMRLAGHINRKTEDLRASLGQMGEPRMLLMAALLVADELFDTKDKAAKAQAVNPQLPLDAGAAVGALTAAADRVDALLARFETGSSPLQR
jgi:cell division protein ZapA